MNPVTRLIIGDAFPASNGPPGRNAYHANLNVLRGRSLSGVYAIVRRGVVLYVGESHTGNLYDTITRHFREWRVDPSRDAQGRRRGGTTYDRRTVGVVYIVTPAHIAQDLQLAEIQRLEPRDNTIDGGASDPAELPV